MRSLISQTLKTASTEHFAAPATAGRCTSRRRTGGALAAVALAFATLALPAVMAEESSAAYRAFFTNSGDDDVSVLDTRTNAQLGGDIAVGSNPGPIAITPDGRRAYVANNNPFDRPGVTVIDTATDEVIVPRIPIGCCASDIAVSPDGARVYVSSNPAGVSVIDTATNTILGSPIPIGSAPEGIVVSPDGSRAYAASLGFGDVSVIDTATNAVAPSKIAAGAGPWGLAITPDGSRLYVVDFKAHAVSAVDTATHAVVATIPIPGAPQWIAITPDGRRAYVTKRSPGGISVIDTATNTLSVPSISVSGTPWRIAIAPDGRRAYATGIYSISEKFGDVWAINTATNSQAGPPIQLGSRPNGVAFTSVQGPNAAVPPVVGKQVNVKPLKGTVKVKCGGDRGFSKLGGEKQISVGCLVDARRGTVLLTSVKGRDGGTQSARFWKGQFRISQAKGKRPYTVLTLTGGLGGAKAKRGRAARPSSAERRQHKKGRCRGQSLWGSGKGRFKTRGEYGFALVRNATWLVADRCNGSTLFKVRKGVAKVRDSRKRKTVVVRAGRRYVAGPRR